MLKRNFLFLIKLSLLIIVILAINSCSHTSAIIPERPNYTRPSPIPEIPILIWIEIENHAALNETDFDDLQDFFDEYEGYLIKIDDILKLYEKE